MSSYPAHAHVDPQDPHDHHAAHDPGAGRAFSISVWLNIGLVIFQLVIGWRIGSLALLGDAAHNASDVVGLLMAWGAARLAMRRPDARHTYGFARSTILAAMFNALALLLTCFWLVIESWQHLHTLPVVPGLWVMIAAAIGFFINSGSAWLFWKQRKLDLNLRGAFLHLAADAAVSLMVVLVGGLLMLTGWAWLDPVAGLLIALFMLVSAVNLLREATDLALDAVPRGLDSDHIRAALQGIEGVERVHDLHIWPLSTTVTALTAHLEHDGTRLADELLIDAQHLLAASFGIEHSTLQLERNTCQPDTHV